MTPFLILVILAGALALSAIIWPQKTFLAPIGLLLLAVALLIGSGK